MVRKYTEEELLGEWKLRLGLLEQDCGCLVTREDGGDLERLLKTQLRSWYSRQLKEADAALLPVRDISGEVEAEVGAGESRISVRPGVRVLTLRLEGWKKTLHSFAKEGDRHHRNSVFPGLEPTAERPLAVRYANEIAAIPAGKVTEMKAVAAPESGYEMDEALLEQLPKDV